MLAPRSESPTGVGLGLRWAFIDEVARGEGPDNVRLFEVCPENYMRRGGAIPDALWQIQARTSVITHGLMMNVGGTTELDAQYLRQLRRFLERMGVRYHSDHLCWTGADGAILHDLLPLPHDRKAVRRCVEQIDHIEQALGLPFAVENISYYLVPGGGLPEAQLITEILEGADCGLLLDVNNVQVNADNHGFDARAFIDALPLHRVVQLHVAGGERRPAMDNLIIDTHGSDVSPRVLALMEHVVERIGPVPVIYERDHDIPPLAELGRQVAVLQEAYDGALARHTASNSSSSSAPDPDPAGAEVGDDSSQTITSLAGIERGLSRVILDPQAEHALASDPAGWLRTQGVESPDERAMAAVGAPRLLVYRSLVRSGLRGVLRAFLPRTFARLGPEGVARIFDQWLDRSAPRSRYFRDVPTEMVEWAQQAWPSDPSVPDYLLDLARLEVLEDEIDAAPDEPPVEGTEAQLVLDRPLSFTGALRIATFDHAVHTLPTDADDRTVPAKEPTTLLLYRDADHEVRTLTLSPLARAVLVRLIDEGQTVSEAVAAGAQDAGEAVDGEVLGRLSTLLADLAERGVLRGSRAAPT